MYVQHIIIIYSFYMFKLSYLINRFLSYGNDIHVPTDGHSFCFTDFYITFKST